MATNNIHIVIRNIDAEDDSDHSGNVSFVFAPRPDAICFLAASYKSVQGVYSIHFMKSHIDSAKKAGLFWSYTQRSINFPTRGKRL